MKNVIILNCKKEIERFVVDAIDLDLPSIALPVILEQIVDILNHEDLDKRDIHGAACNYINNCKMDLFYDPVQLDGAENHLYSAMLKLAGSIRNKLRHHHAYVDGQFPFTFKKIIHDGTFYLTRR